MMRRDEKVLVVGASFAGLATAFWMNRLGYNVTVVEVAPALRKGGTPVDIREGVVDVVRRMGLLERIEAVSLADRPMDFVGSDGIVLGRMSGPPGSEHVPREGYEVERDVLLQMLFDWVKDDVEVIFGDTVTGLEDTGEAVAVTFKLEPSRSFDYVLGCDGTHSAVRKMCFGEEALYSHFLQHYFSLTIVPKLLLTENTHLNFNAPGRTVMLTAYNGKTDIAFCFLSENEIDFDRRDVAQQKQMIRQHFQGRGWIIPQLLEEMTRSGDFYFDKLCQIRMDSWSRGRVALVGDAAYCPSPAAGMGGSMAILGAAALADAFAKFPGDHLRAFQDYDTSFRPLAEQIQRDAVDFGMAMVMPRTEEAIERRNKQFGLG